ncbi:citrate lyase acyl carrier protein [Fusobacterium polymorphum]|uniref:Citrate lyase acyl carrier protein n=1 Tax=Fusobacterium nucleatum subsp. polymorphum TaxID=76857 RepID=A0A2B7YPC1_FUSNP|nr:citrate lyase acyl carrier protein [Fusobacterium polymorphum]PGH22698.1 citrate lyase acyl carrier protein [Fusobacterium polymorphum]
MEIKKIALAGTLESSDVQVTVKPSDKGVNLSLESSNQYGQQIKDKVLETLDRLEVKNIKINVIDKGALDCTIKARVECAVLRACEVSDKNIA